MHWKWVDIHITQQISESRQCLYQSYKQHLSVQRDRGTIIRITRTLQCEVRVLLPAPCHCCKVYCTFISYQCSSCKTGCTAGSLQVFPHLCSQQFNVFSHFANTLNCCELTQPLRQHAYSTLRGNCWFQTCNPLAVRWYSYITAPCDVFDMQSNGCVNNLWTKQWSHE